MIDLNEEQELLTDEWKRIAENEFAENAFTYQGRTPWENLELLADRGHLGINLPEEYGGGGLTEKEVILQTEAIGRTCPDTATKVRELSLIAPRAIAMFGSEAAKERYLPLVTNAESYIAIAISEPQAGSDVQGMDTTVKEGSDGELYLTGEKTWVSEVPDSEAAVVWAQFPDEGLGTVIMDFDAPGVEVVEHYTNMYGGTQTHFFMEDVRIPEENVLLRGSNAFKKQLKALNWERCATAIGATVFAMCAFDKALEYAQSREQFGQPIADFQGIRWKLADMAKQIEASRALVYRTVENAERMDRVPDRFEAQVASLYAAEMAESVVSEALQIHGANGYQKGHPLEYLYRWVRGRRIGGGTDEVQKNLIANLLLEEGLPGLG